MYFVNWQREVSVEERNGQKVVVKRNKSTKEFHEYLLLYMYSLISVVLAHPSSPPAFGEIVRNEGRDMRRNLKAIGISTPALLSISDSGLVEEYIEGGDLYIALVGGADTSIAFHAGRLTGKMHKAGYVFVDNKAQNYLVDTDSVVRTDLGFIKKSDSLYARSMDTGSFLASVMDLAAYSKIEKAFYEGYLSEMGRGFPYLTVVIRNVLSLGFSSNSKTTVANMILDAMPLISV